MGAVGPRGGLREEGRHLTVTAERDKGKEKCNCQLEGSERVRERLADGLTDWLSGLWLSCLATEDHKHCVREEYRKVRERIEGWV